MPIQQTGNLRFIHEVDDHKKAVVFIHGFTGQQDDTWDAFPETLKDACPDWSIATLGYATTLLPDLVGIWSADPDLPIVATMLKTQTEIEPLNQYESLAFVAHSMGGLAVQKALVDAPDLHERTSLVILFGTPSAGLKKASLIQFWKRQLNNMSENSDFILGLRQGWSERFGAKPPFGFMTVAGTEDQFVPPSSSLDPFIADYRFVVPGDHLSIVKPVGEGAESLRLVRTALIATQEDPVLGQTRDNLHRELEDATKAAIQNVDAKAESVTEEEVVDAALALDRADKREASIALMRHHLMLRPAWTDLQGSLGGRFKRLWLETGEEHYASDALGLYEQALATSRKSDDHEQIYYHAINVAFLTFMTSNSAIRVRDLAELALQHCAQALENFWQMATQAEANLYLGNRKLALDQYRKATDIKDAPEPWQLASTGLQAGQISLKLGDKDLADRLEEIFSPGSRQTNKIFISYSHKDSDWLKRLQDMLKPWLRQAESELDLWDDTRIKPGDKWFKEIEEALKTAGVAVALVSKEFLASDFVAEHELPKIFLAAEEGDVRLLWLYLKPAAYEATAFKDIQAAHTPLEPALSGRSEFEQEEVLKEVSKQIVMASLSATEQYIKAP